MLIVHYKDQNNEETDLNNVTEPTPSELPIEEIFEPDFDILVSEEDLFDTIIDERYLIGELIAVGHVGTIREGVWNDLVVLTYDR